jgi:hypothetical protein
MGRLPSKSSCVANHRLRCCLLRPVFTNVVINNVTATLTATLYTNDHYVCHALVFLNVLRVHVFLLHVSVYHIIECICMFELHMVVVVSAMFYIPKLIMKLLSNY